LVRPLLNPKKTTNPKRKYKKIFPFQNGFIRDHTKIFPPNNMRSPLNALTDTIESLGLRTSVLEYVHNLGPNQWQLKILSLPNAETQAHLVIEVIEEEDGDATVCVLQRKNVGRRVMNRILNRLCEMLDDDDVIYDPPSQQPPSPARPVSPQQ
jgi:hypothetical protein